MQFTIGNFRPSATSTRPWSGLVLIWSVVHRNASAVRDFCFEPGVSLIISLRNMIAREIRRGRTGFPERAHGGPVASCARQTAAENASRTISRNSRMPDRGEANQGVTAPGPELDAFDGEFHARRRRGNRPQKSPDFPSRAEEFGRAMGEWMARKVLILEVGSGAARQD